jgi:hypothetical protein
MQPMVQGGGMPQAPQPPMIQGGAPAMNDAQAFFEAAQ